MCEGVDEMNRRIIILLISICFLVTSCAESQHTPDLDVPAEVLEVFENFMNAFKIGTPEAINYVYIEDDFIREAFLISGNRILDYKIENVEMINDKLYAFGILLKLEWYVDFQSGYYFVGLINDNWYLMINVRDVPTELRENLDESRYIRTGEDIVDVEDVIQTPIEFPDN